jgi:hypothetical protein
MSTTRHHHCGGGCAIACLRTRVLYSAVLLVKIMYASLCAGLLGFGVSSSSWMPSRICFTVIDGRQPSSCGAGRVRCSVGRSVCVWSERARGRQQQTVARCRSTTPRLHVSPPRRPFILTLPYLIQDAEAHSPGGVDVRVEESSREAALQAASTGERVRWCVMTRGDGRGRRAQHACN